MSNYPECEKAKRFENENRAITSFLEWLQDENMVICQLQERGNGLLDQYFPTTIRPEEIIAKHLDIDLKKIDKEQRKILEELRNQQKPKERRKVKCQKKNFQQ